jgi:hypothetical protein
MVALLLLPSVGLSTSHEALSVMLQLSMPPPLLLILKVCGAGREPFWVALKCSVVGFKTM